MTARAVAGTCCLILSATLGVARAQTPPVARPAAAIAGRVVSPDQPAQPVRRALVVLSGSPGGDRRVATDDDGRFVFADLAAGRYSLKASKPGSVDAAYGATDIGGPGTALALTAGARADAVIVMARGAVVEGTVRNAAGEPLPGVTISALVARGDGQVRSGNRPTVNTDDRGMYRIFGLAAGSYVLRATRPAASVYGRIEIPSTREIDQALARAASGPETERAPAPPTPAFRGASFAPVYYPGSPFADEAASLVLKSGDERTGLDITFDPWPTATLRGQVAGGVSDVGRAQVVLQPRDQNPIAARRASLTSDGRFTLPDVTPGRYTLLARWNPDPAAPAPGAGGARVSILSEAEVARSSGVAYSWAAIDVDVRGDDIDSLSLLLQPGASLGGRIEADAGGAIDPRLVSSILVSLRPTGPANARGVITDGFTQLRAATVRGDGTFQIDGIGPGSYAVNVTVPPALASAGWWARSAMVATEDLLDTGLRVVQGSDLGRLAISLSNRKTLLYGQLNGVTGRPASEYSILAFPVAPALRGIQGRRTQVVRPGSDGRYRIDGLPPGEYHVAVLSTVSADALANADFYAAVAPLAIRVTLADGEQRVQDVKIAR